MRTLKVVLPIVVEGEQVTEGRLTDWLWIRWVEDNNTQQFVFLTDTGKWVRQKGLARVRRVGGVISDTAVAQLVGGPEGCRANGAGDQEGGSRGRKPQPQQPNRYPLSPKTGRQASKRASRQASKQGGEAERGPGGAGLGDGGRQSARLQAP